MSINYVFDNTGREIAVLIPVEEWREIVDKLRAIGGERDGTSMLLNNSTMRHRLLDALQSTERMTWDEVKDALGL